MNGDEITEAVARRRERRWLVPLLAITQVLGLACGAILLIAFDDGSLGVTGRLIVFLAVLATLIIVNGVVFAFFRWRRRRETRLFALSPLWELPDRRDRAALVRALRRGDPITPERRELARRTARDVVGRRGLVWLYVGIAVLMAANGVVQLLISDSTHLGIIAGAFMFASAAFALAGAGYFAWLIHRMRLALAALDVAPSAGT